MVQHGDREDEGLDDVSTNLCRVLFARFMDQVVLSFFYEVLSIKYIVTTDDSCSLRSKKRKKERKNVASGWI